MPRETEMPAVDWRQAAEEIGRQAFETAVAPEPEPILEPLVWLRKMPLTRVGLLSRTKRK